MSSGLLSQTWLVSTLGSSTVNVGFDHAAFGLAGGQVPTRTRVDASLRAVRSVAS